MSEGGRVMAEIITITIAQVNPFVRHVHRCAVHRHAQAAPCKGYDRRLFYVESGAGSILCQNETFPVEPGALVTFPPGTRYRMTNERDEPLCLIAVNFDMLQTQRMLCAPVAPDVCAEFAQWRVIERVNVCDCPAANGPVFLNHAEALGGALKAMLEEAQADEPYTADVVSGLMKSVLCRVYREAERPGASARLAPSGAIRGIMEYIALHCQEALTNEQIGARFNYHPNYVSRQVRLYTGKSLHQYVLACRIERAMELLACTRDPIARVAAECGFGDARHFTKAFSGKVGLSPSRYRAQNAKGKSEAL